MRPNFFDSPRSVFNFFRREYFSSPLRIFELVVAVGSAVILWLNGTQFASEVNKSLGATPGLLSYLWFTYAATVVLFAACVVVYRKVQIVLPRTRKERDLIAIIQHKMAEVVRAAAVRSDRGGLDELSRNKALNALLSNEIPDYLESKFGHRDISIAVKYLSSRKLKALFRHTSGGAHEDNRCDEMEQNESLVFFRFARSDRRVQRIVFLDTKDIRTDPALGAEERALHESYRLYAKRCGFRSVLAFPLRSPRPLKSTTSGESFRASPIHGFLSLDCPEPRAFENIFGVSLFSKPSNDGAHYKDSKELQFFFGLADSLATLALLFDEDRARVLLEDSGGEATSHANP